MKFTLLRGGDNPLATARSIAGHRMLRAPHYTCSRAALTGRLYDRKGTDGTVLIYQPGEIALASPGGVLVLDDLAEWRRDIIEAIGQVMRTDYITFGFKGITLKIPVSFEVVGILRPLEQTMALDARTPGKTSPSLEEAWQRRVDFHLDQLMVPTLEEQRS